MIPAVEHRRLRSDLEAARSEAASESRHSLRFTLMALDAERVGDHDRARAFFDEARRAHGNAADWRARAEGISQTLATTRAA